MLKNIASTVSSHYGSQVVALITNILLARYLGGQGFGEYTLISSVFLIGNALTTFGTDMVLVRKLSADFDPHLLGDGLLLQLVLSVLYIAGIFLIDWFIPLPISMKIYIFSLIPFSFYTIFTIAVRVNRQVKIYAVAQFLIALFQLIVVIVLPFIHGDMLAIAGLFLLSYVIISLWGYVFYTNALVKISFSFQRLVNLGRDCLQMAFIGTIRLVYERIASVILPAFVGLSLTGIFSIAMRLVTSGKLGYFSAFIAIYPEMARNQEIGRKMKGLGLLLGTSMAFSLFLHIFARQVIVLLFGAEYIPAVPSLQILAWSIVPYVLVIYLSQGLAALGYEKPILHGAALSLLALIVCLLVLTPFFGIIGASIAILAGELIYAGLMWWHWNVYVLSKTGGYLPKDSLGV